MSDDQSTGRKQSPTPVPAASATDPWHRPLDPDAYDRSPELTRAELTALAEVEARRQRQAGHWPRRLHNGLRRLRQPVRDALTWTGAYHATRTAVQSVLVRGMLQYRVAYWGWTLDEWERVLRLPQDRHNRPQYVLHGLATAYLLCDIHDLHPRFQGLRRGALAAAVFGRARFTAVVERVQVEARGWGYGPWLTERGLPNAVGALLLPCGSPRLEDVTPGTISTVVGEGLAWHLGMGVGLVARVLVHLGILSLVDLPPALRGPTSRARPGAEGALVVPPDVAPEWGRWCQRWYVTSTLSPAVRKTTEYYLFKAGRWLAAHHPDVDSPAQWTRELAAEYIAAVDRMAVGDWAQSWGVPSTTKTGNSLGPATKDRHLNALRTFFRDGQEWGWFPRRFDPRRALATPSSVMALIGPKPRVIADDVWAKLLWAGLNLSATDLPDLYRTKSAPYPLSMVRALVITWLFAGLRANEVRRLRVGCVRWQWEDATITGSSDVLPKNAVCWLDVPTSKTATSFTKAVDRVVGDAIQAWEHERPTGLPAMDPKTNEQVQFLFSYHGRQVAQGYLNQHVIPVLCRKAGVPTRDARGNITSHRARSTIASQLANGKQPLTLLELMEWLGHRHPSSTLHYVKVAPTRLAKAYAEADYFARNLRAIDLLIDRDAIESGAMAPGKPWRFYDLGHGYCTYSFFDQCPHRMACAKCSFYRPKGSAQAQLLEGKANLLRTRQEIPLLDAELAAIDDGVEAMDQLLAKLADVPTPDGGPTPRQRASPQPEPPS